MDSDLIKLLTTTGFTNKEARIYLALLELGQGDVTDIAKISELKRSIIYVLLEGLIKRGHVSEMPDQKINTYQAADPLLILHQLKTTTKNFSEMLPLLHTLRNTGENRPIITYYETKEGIWNTYEEMNHNEDSFLITSYERIEKHFPGAVETWIKNYQRKLYCIRGRHLIPETSKELVLGKKLKAVDQQVRSLEDLNNIDMDFTIFGKKISITFLGKKPFIVIIESEELTKSMKPIFEIAWAKGKEIK